MRYLIRLDEVQTKSRAAKKSSCDKHVKSLHGKSKSNDAHAQCAEKGNSGLTR